VKLFWSDFTPYPRLCLEYVSGGSLAEQQNISAVECVLVLRQCLSALEYLHGSNPPIVHRDIKADNILVQDRDSDHISVKFGDFGLSRDCDNLSTICGNRLHLAPEIYQNQQYIDAGGEERVSYTAAVDVWFLGVVVYGLLCPLPGYEERYLTGGTAWCENIIKKFKKDLEERSDELRQFLLEAMVVIRPDKRWSAQACHAKAELLPITAEGRCETPRTASYADEDERTTIRYRTKSSVANGPSPQTVLWRSDAPPPPRSSASASRPSRKRPTTVSTSSSSSRRHTKRRDHSSRGVESASRRQLDPFLGNQRWLPPEAWRDRGQDGDAYDWNHPGDDNAHAQPLYPIDHLPASSVGLEVNYPLADYAEGPPHLQALGEWEQNQGEQNQGEQNRGVLPDRAPEQSTPPNQPGDDGLVQPSQIDNAWADQEAVDTAVLLQAAGRHFRADNHLRSVNSFPRRCGADSNVRRIPSVSGPLTRPALSETPSEVSHLSTRDLLFDREDLVYMVIRRQAVSMRISDCQLNASQILTAANLQKDERVTWLREFKERGIGGNSGKNGRLNYWVPFSDGVFLCQAVGLEDDLRPLFSYSPLTLPNREENYLLVRRRRPIRQELQNEFAGLPCGNCVIAYQPSKRIINATHLLKASNIARHKLTEFFAKNPRITKEIINHGNRRTLGTYISFEQARVFCDYFNLNSASVRCLLTGGSVSVSPKSVHKDTEAATYGRGGAGCGAPRNLDYPGNDLSAVTGLQASKPNQMPNLDCSHHSMFTEANYENGSYLAPRNRSYLQLLN
jgi:serine/threonine protein kinase